MSEITHTPGPWSQGYLLATQQTQRWPAGTRTAMADQERRMVFANFRASDEGRSRIFVGRFRNSADAQLAAAAPTMLKSLRELIGQAGEGLTFSERIENAKAAILAATGEVL